MIKNELRTPQSSPRIPISPGSPGSPGKPGKPGSPGGPCKPNNPGGPVFGTPIPDTPLLPIILQKLKFLIL